MTTLKLRCGDDSLMISADLARAESPVQACYEGDAWLSTPWQTADCRHRVAGLEAIGRRLLAEALGADQGEIECEEEEEAR